MLVAALVNAPFTPYGVAQIWSSVIFGLILELPFAITLYRTGSRRMFWIAHPLSQLLVIPFYIVGFDLTAFAWWVLAIVVVLALASATFFTWLAQYLAGRLQAAGVARLPVRRIATDETADLVVPPAPPAAE
jgi:energy-coupling factor transport system substrate-specific component